MMCNNPNVDLDMNAYILTLVKFCPFILKIFSGNELLA